MKCLYHTEGENCHLCREGYYGSALQQDCRSEWETRLQPLHQPCRGQQQTPERFLPTNAKFYLQMLSTGAFGVEGKPYYYQLELPAAALQLGEAPGWEGALYI